VRLIYKTKNGVKSTLERSRTGRLVLTVSYSGNGWDAAIEQAIRQHGMGERAGVTVIAVPVGFGG
jgi:uncharacterized membrane protein YfhO